MTFASVFTDAVGYVLKLAIALILAVASQYLAIKLFDRLTPRIDEMKELQRGNVAVGLVLASLVISISLVISAGIDNLLPLPNLGKLSVNTFEVLVKNLGGLLLTIILAIVAQFFAINVFDKLTHGIDEQQELKKGNLAVAILLSAIIIAVSLVIRSGVRAV